MAKQTVLLVDADTRSARVLEVSLRKAGYSVTLVKSAAEAVEAIDIAPPDLVLSDTRLAPPPSDKGQSTPPPMDGYQLCRRLKDDPVWYSIPFIFLTSSSSIEDKIRGLELGVEDYLTKPIYIKEILTRIQLVLAKKTREGMEGRTSRASFTGLLSEMGLVDLLSTIDLGRKSGVLDLEGSMKGTVFFRDGKVVDARCGTYQGASAIYRMLVWNDGRFEIRFGPCPVEDVIDMSTQGILMEGMRRLDEWQRLQEQLPPLDAVYEVDTKELASRLGEIPDEVNQILRAFNGERTLLEVVDESGFDDLGALGTLSKLYFEGLIFPKPAQPGAETDDGSAVLPAGVDDDASRATSPGARGSEPLIEARPSVSTSIPPPAVVVAEPPNADSAHGTPTANAEARRDADLSGLSHGTTLDDRGTDPSADDADEHEERDVAKHRGKRKRAKREMMSDVGSAAPATSTAAATPPRREESEPTVAAATARAASPAVAAEPRMPDERPSDEKVRADAAPEARPRVDSGNNVIQFPKSPAVLSTPAPAERAAEVPERDFKKTLPMGTVLDELTKESKPATETKEPAAAEARPAEKPEPAAAKSTESAPAKSTPPTVEPSKPAASVPPATQATEARRDSRAPETTRKEKSEPPAREKTAAKAGDKVEGKEGESKRDRKISFSGELSDEAKAFFQDKSYEAAYKHHHDTFEDLKAEDPPDHKRNKNSMILTGSMVALVVLVIGGLALHDRFFGVREPTLPPVTTAAATAAPSNPETPGANPAPPANAQPEHPAAAPSTANAAPAAPAQPSNTAAAAPPATATAPAAPTANAPTPAAPTAAEAPTANAAATPPATNQATAPTPPAAATAPSAPTTAAATPPAAAAAAAPTPPATAAATSAPAATAPGANPAAPGAPAQSVADLLHAATRARAHGARAADQAYQAWVAAGGNDAAAMSSFAYWLASSQSDLGRAADWAQRATAIDANNQQAWYVLGVSRLEGPHADRAVARDALRHCSQLPGPYASECRGAM